MPIVTMLLASMSFNEREREMKSGYRTLLEMGNAMGSGLFPGKWVLGVCVYIGYGGRGRRARLASRQLAHFFLTNLFGCSSILYASICWKASLLKALITSNSALGLKLVFKAI